MAISFVEIDGADINSATDATSYVSASVTPPTAGVIYVWILSANNSGLNAVNTVTGWGLTWEEIASTQWLADDRRISLWAAKASGATAGTVTIGFGANTQLGCTALFGSADGVDTSGTLQSIFVQKPTSSGTAASGSITLSAAGHADNRPISGWAHASNEGKTPRTNWTEEDDLGGDGPTRNLETQYRSDTFETTASASWATSNQWGGIAAELKADVAGGTTHTGAADLAITCTIVTAGIRIATGAFDLPVTVNRDVVGTKIATGVISVPVTVQVDSTGSRTAIGALDLAVAVAVEVVGTLTALGAVDMPISVSIDTIGTLDVWVLGSASLEITTVIEVAGRFFRVALSPLSEDNTLQLIVLPEEDPE